MTVSVVMSSRNYYLSFADAGFIMIGDIVSEKGEIHNIILSLKLNYPMRFKRNDRYSIHSDGSRHIKTVV